MLSGSSRHLGSDSGILGHLSGGGTERRNATVAMGGTGARGVRMRILAGPHGRQSGPTRGERAGLHSGAFDVVLNVDAPWDRCARRRLRIDDTAHVAPRQARRCVQQHTI